jgi:hypothetical protein
MVGYISETARAQWACAAVSTVAADRILKQITLRSGNKKKM